MRSKGEHPENRAVSRTSRVRDLPAGTIAFAQDRRWTVRPFNVPTLVLRAKPRKHA